MPLFALAGCFLTLCHRFSLDSFAKWACRRSCFLQHARRDKPAAPRRRAYLCSQQPGILAGGPPPDRGGPAAPGGLRPPGPPDAIGAALGAPVQRRFCCGGWRGCIALSELFGVWVIGDGVFWRSPNAALCGGIGGAQRIRDVGSATLLRLVAPPEVTAAHRLIARADAV